LPSCSLLLLGTKKKKKNIPVAALSFSNCKNWQYSAKFRWNRPYFSKWCDIVIFEIIPKREDKKKRRRKILPSNFLKKDSH